MLVGTENRQIVSVTAFGDVLVHVFEIFSDEKPNSSVAAVGTRDTVGPSLITRILQTVLLVRQNNLVDALCCP